MELKGTKGGKHTIYIYIYVSPSWAMSWLIALYENTPLPLFLTASTGTKKRRKRVRASCHLVSGSLGVSGTNIGASPPSDCLGTRHASSRKNNASCHGSNSRGVRTWQNKRQLQVCAGVWRRKGSDSRIKITYSRPRGCCCLLVATVGCLLTRLWMFLMPLVRLHIFPLSVTLFSYFQFLDCLASYLPLHLHYPLFHTLAQIRASLAIFIQI